MPRSDKEKKEIYDKWKGLINMSQKALDGWAKNPARLEASLNREKAKSEGGIQSGLDSLHRIKRRRSKPFKEWSDQDFDNAAQENGFNGRMLGGKIGQPVGNTGMSKWEISLRNWGHDPSLSSSPANSKYKTWKKQNAEAITMSKSKKAKGIHEKQFEIANALSQVDPEIAKVMVTTGDKAKDKIPATKKKEILPEGLYPSQTTIKIVKSVNMAIGMIQTDKIGGDLSAVISSDNYIMDGHHRWAATILVGGGAVGGLVANLRGSLLVRVLNILTKGYFLRRKGNTGSGKLSDLTPANIESLLREALVNGLGGDYPKSPSEVEDALVKHWGDVEAGIKAMSKNADNITKTTPSWAKNRENMPVIKKKELPEVQKLLSEGLVDWNAPYSRAASQVRVAYRYLLRRIK